VDKFYDYVYQRLKKKVFYDVDTLNTYTLPIIDEFNSKLFTGHTRSRKEIYESEERPCMMPLPDTHYRIRYRKEVTIGPNYHVKVGSEQHLYSVPYTCVSKKAIVLWILKRSRSMSITRGLPYINEILAINQPPLNAICQRIIGLIIEAGTVMPNRSLTEPSRLVPKQDGLWTDFSRAESSHSNHTAIATVFLPWV
jgi:hypothetical protein